MKKSIYSRVTAFFDVNRKANNAQDIELLLTEKFCCDLNRLYQLRYTQINYAINYSLW